MWMQIRRMMKNICIIIQMGLPRYSCFVKDVEESELEKWVHSQ
jgi:hypothetical protein